MFGCFGCGISLVYEGFVSTCQAPAASGKIRVVNLRYVQFVSPTEAPTPDNWLGASYSGKESVQINKSQATGFQPPDALPGREKHPCIATFGARSAKKATKQARV